MWEQTLTRKVLGWQNIYEIRYPSFTCSEKEQRKYFKMSQNFLNLRIQLKPSCLFPWGYWFITSEFKNSKKKKKILLKNLIMQTMLLRLCQIYSMNQIILRALGIRLAIMWMKAETSHMVLVPNPLTFRLSMRTAEESSMDGPWPVQEPLGVLAWCQLLSEDDVAER